jgi:hypothetical protein
MPKLHHVEKGLVGGGDPEMEEGQEGIGGDPVLLFEMRRKSEKTLG